MLCKAMVLSKKVEKAITQTIYPGLGMSHYLLHNGYEACSAHGGFLEDLHAEQAWHTVTDELILQTAKRESPRLVGLSYSMLSFYMRRFKDEN